MAVQFFFADASVTLTQRIGLKDFIYDLFKTECKKLDTLTYIFCSDDYLLNINKSFLKHDYYTDIITFDLSDSTREVQGEIYISVDRVRDNAATLGVSLKEELHRVIFHGALHLCGYKDKSKEDTLKMREAENRCLALYFKP